MNRENHMQNNQTKIKESFTIDKDLSHKLKSFCHKTFRKKSSVINKILKDNQHLIR